MTRITITTLGAIFVFCSCGAGADRTRPTLLVEGGLSGVQLVERELPARADSTTRPSPPDARGTLATQEMSDEELGRLILRLSEETGDFPSENHVSNETSYLHVAPTLLEPELRGRAYVGVGPEQNLSYFVMLKARMVYIVDIRRQNMLQHMVFRALIERSETREAFLGRLVSRTLPSAGTGLAADTPVETISKVFAKTRGDRALLDEGVEDTLSLMKRLGVPEQPGDRASVRKVMKAFFTKGLELSYSMEGSRRRYPPIRELLASADDEGIQRGFLANEESYGLLRSMYKANRIVPIVGDFLGDKALAGAAEDMNDRGLKLGVFYTSNVEQYLFPEKSYRRFVANVDAFPRDESSVIVRVWFDQGKAHPAQRPGHRTTSIVTPLAPFLERCEARPYHSYWEVATDRLD